MGRSTTEEARATLALQQAVLRQARAARDPGRLHLRFDVAVAEAYRGGNGVELLRTRTVGRISVGRRWSADVGIASDGSLHVPFQEFVDRVPRMTGRAGSSTRCLIRRRRASCRCA